MTPIILLILVFVAYIVMYRIYGKFLSKRIFQINDTAIAPSVEFEDDFDYVPTKKEIVFGHHFTSIAGTGPIVGPAIAIIWGWVPAVLWVVFGSIFIGAVHDFGVLIASMRNKGNSIADITGIYISKRTKMFFYIIGLLEIWIFIAILGLIMSIIFSLFPGSVIPIWLEIPIAVWFGYQVYKKKKNLLLYSIIAVGLMYLTVVIGTYIPINMPEIFGIPTTGVWTIIFLIYAYIASILPVTTLLQPRDYINSHQLIVAMGLLIVGIILTTFQQDFAFVAPEFNLSPEGAPPIMPFLFIIIACGAVSGFHAIVSSGTSSKQIEKEKDALFIGYGGMLTEGLLAILVIIAVAAGIGLGVTNSAGEVTTGINAFSSNYGTWSAASGMASKVSAFVEGSANIVSSVGIPKSIALIVMGVFVASFAGTSLDTATRLQRYFVDELLDSYKVKAIKNKYFTTFLVVASAAWLAFVSGADGKGALILWPLFGIVNQILATLALIVLSVYLKKKGGLKWLITGLPAVFMAVFTIWSSIYNHFEWYGQHNELLVIINLVTLILSILIIIEGANSLFRIKP